MNIVVTNMNQDLAGIEWTLKEIDHNLGLFNKLQKENRNIWEKYFTPNGFVDAIDNFLMDIKCKNT